MVMAIEWWGDVQRRLAELERDWAWLARKVEINDATLSAWRLGHRRGGKPPERVRRDIEMVLGMSGRRPEPITDEVAA